jgi:NADH-quinone oxidoreductase subunit D
MPASKSSEPLNLSQQAPAPEEVTAFVPSRPNFLNRAQFLLDLKKHLAREFIKEIPADSSIIIIINRARIRDVALFMKERGYLLGAMFASDLIRNFELNYVYRCYPFIPKSQLIIQTQIDKSVEIPTISDYFLNADSFELNLTHRLGAKFTLSTQSGPIVEEKKGIVTIEANKICVPTSVSVPSKLENPTKLGILHPIHKDRFYFDLNIIDGQIQKVELVNGWLYKNVHSQLEKCHFITDIPGIFEQISTNSIVHLNLAYYQALEAILEKKVPNKARYIRTLAAELERIRSHLLWFVNLAYILGMDRRYVELLEITSEIERENNIFLKSPNLHTAIIFGGTPDVNMSDSARYLHYLKENDEKIFNTLLGLVYDSFTEEKCRKIGFISGCSARLSGLTGPALRGSGVQIDIRSTDPYLAYLTGDLSQVWSVISFRDGDVFARVQTRLWEIKESFNICKNILVGLSNYELPLKLDKLDSKLTLPAETQMLQTVESPQGALSVYIRGDPKNSKDKAYTVRICPPDAANFAVLNREILPKQYIRDLPLILHSLDLNFQMIDL